MSAGSDLSVVIPSYRSRYLGEVVAEARRLEPREIIVVDSSPEPPRLEGPDIRLVRLEKRTWAGRARNIGARQARGSHLLFLDSDCVLTAPARRYIESHLRDSQGGLVSGSYRSVPGRGRTFSRLQTHILRYRMDRAQARRRPLFSSANFLVERDVYRQVGGFNEELATYEDVELGARGARLGYRVAYAPELEVDHRKELSAAGLVADFMRKAFNAFQIRRRYPAVFEKVPSFMGGRIISTLLLGAMLFPAAAIGVLLVGTIGWPILLSALSVLLFSLFPFIVRLTPGEPIGARLASLLVWPWVGAGVGAALVASALVWYARQGWRMMRSGLDFVRAGWRVVRRSGLPVQVIAYVTSRCNLRCEHCFYKETLDAPDPGELPLAVFDRATRSIGSVLWFALGGGEPFIRKDLAELVALVRRNSRPKVFSFPTNGWYTERTFETSLRILHQMDDGNLILFFSLDGDELTHDQIRGEGSFCRVKATMERLRPLTELYPRLYLNVVMTVTPRNAPRAAALVDEIVRDFRPSAISINLFRYHSLQHPPLPPALLDGYEAAVKAYAAHLRRGALEHYGFFGGRVLLLKEILQKELILRVARHDEFVTPCTAGTLGYVIMEDGRVKPCEILPDQIGNVTNPETTLAEMVRSPGAQRLRERIVEGHCRCTYECAMSTNTLFSWPMTRRLGKALSKDVLWSS